MNDASRVQLLPDEAFLDLPAGISFSSRPSDYEIEPWLIYAGWWGGYQGSREAAARFFGAIQQHGDWCAVVTSILVRSWEEEHLGRILHRSTESWIPRRSKLGTHYNAPTLLMDCLTHMVEVGLLDSIVVSEGQAFYPTQDFIRMLEPMKKAGA